MKLYELKAKGGAEFTSGYSFSIRQLKPQETLCEFVNIIFFFISSTSNVQIISSYIRQQWITTTDSVGSSLRQLIKEHASFFPFPSHTLFTFFSAPSSFQPQDTGLLLLNHKHGIWSSSGHNFRLMIVAKPPVNSDKYTSEKTVKISTNHKSEGTTKAQKSSCLLCSWEYLFFWNALREEFLRMT